MLIDDEKRFVELIIDNIMWGNITLDWNAINKEKDHKKFISDLGKYIGLKTNIHDKNRKELNDVIPELALQLTAFRVYGAIKGELRDREQELENKNLKTKVNTLESENKQAVEQLSHVNEENELLKSNKPLKKDFSGFT